MSVIDAFVLGILAVGLALGCVRGFVSQFTGVAGLFGGLYLSASYHDAFRRVLDRHIATGHNGEIAFGVILVLSILVAAFVGWLAKKTFDKLDLGAYDRLMGGFFGAAKAGLICAGVLLAVVYFAPDGGQLEASISRSKSGPMLWGAMDSVVGVLPKEYRGSAQGFLHANSPKDEHRTAQ
ncbi:MAG TPA: CvpA family protein [Planctomycetota bacterium]|nr:CvpA family protein [Planctomycetota bacterium]